MRYKVLLNLKGEVMCYWMTAFSKDQAFFYAVQRLARDAKMSVYSLRNYFLSKPQCYTVETV